MPIYDLRQPCHFCKLHCSPPYLR
uniref:Uncharacterized protein n=1 Tax=Anguilla anguilla TaxID=7936 RepID=A0A0E9PS51_ANGAN